MQHITDRVKAVAHSQAGQGGVEYVLVTLLAVVVVGIITAVTKSGGFEAGIQGVIEEIFGRFMDGKK
ncbi:MAG: hypothetical protein M3343_00765 [Actinomycetota bacterium]|nr:hypothetical protein [Actinomycetota bacterium]